MESLYVSEITPSSFINRAYTVFSPPSSSSSQSVINVSKATVSKELKSSKLDISTVVAPSHVNLISTKCEGVWPSLSESTISISAEMFTVILSET